MVTLQLGVDDGAGSSAHRQLLSGLHLVAEVGEAALRVHLKLLLQGGAGRHVNDLGWTVLIKLYLNARQPSRCFGRILCRPFLFTKERLANEMAAFGDWYLFLSRHPLLVPLPPGWVVDVLERFVSRRDSARSEQLRRGKTADERIDGGGQTVRSDDAAAPPTCSSAFLSLL